MFGKVRLTRTAALSVSCARHVGAAGLEEGRRDRRLLLRVPAPAVEVLRALEAGRLAGLELREKAEHHRAAFT